MAVAERPTCECALRREGHAARTRHFRQVFHGTQPDRGCKTSVYARLADRPDTTAGGDAVPGHAVYMRGIATHLLDAPVDRTGGSTRRLAAPAVARQGKRLARIIGSRNFR